MLTLLEKLLEIRDVAVESEVEYVYIGNVGNPKYGTTYSPR